MFNRWHLFWCRNTKKTTKDTRLTYSMIRNIKFTPNDHSLTPAINSWEEKRHTVFVRQQKYINRAYSTTTIPTILRVIFLFTPDHNVSLGDKSLKLTLFWIFFVNFSDQNFKPLNNLISSLGAYFSKGNIILSSKGLPILGGYFPFWS